MSKLIINCRKLRTEQDFAQAERAVNDGVQILRSFDTTIYTTWKKRYDYLKPGVATDGTQALEIAVRLSGGDENDSGDVLARTVGAFFGQEFGGDNLLSCCFKEGSSPICTVVILPLDHRKLNPDKWLNAHHKELLSDDVTKRLEKAVKIAFPELAVDAETANPDDPTEIGYADALVKFKPAEYKKEDDTELVWDTREADAQIQTEMPYDQLKAITNAVLTYFTVGPEHVMFERAQRKDTEISQDDFMTRVDDHIRMKYPKVQSHDREIILKKIYSAVYQNYILEPLINDDAISDIKVIAPNRIRVKVGGERYTSNFTFIDKDDYLRFIYSLAVRNNLDIKENAINVFSDVTSNPKFRMRFNITTPYINSVEYPYLHIRKIAKKKRGLDYLLKCKMMDQKVADYLIDRARNGKGMIFTGKGASGKTTLMNMLLDYIPFDKSGLVIQESDELFSDVHPDLMFQHVTMNVARGEKTYDLQDEARNGLLTDLDYFIIGEVKGAEAKYFINAADTGHRCWCSVHSPSSMDAIDKLADYVMYETKYSKEEATYMLKDLGTVISDLHSSLSTARHKLTKYTNKRHKP